MIGQPPADGLIKMMRKEIGRVLGSSRTVAKKRRQDAAQSWQQLTPDATSVEVSGTTPISAQAEEEEERARGKEKTRAKENSTRRVTDQARGQAREAQDQGRGAGTVGAPTSAATVPTEKVAQKDSRLWVRWMAKE